MSPVVGRHHQHVVSKHFHLNSADISALGLRPGSTWKEHEAEFAALKKKRPHLKRVLFLRHGEGIHNAAERELGKEVWENSECTKEKYFDPPLNKVGVSQAQEVGVALKRPWKKA